MAGDLMSKLTAPKTVAKIPKAIPAMKPFRRPASRNSGSVIPQLIKADPRKKAPNGIEEILTSPPIDNKTLLLVPITENIFVYHLYIKKLLDSSLVGICGMHDKKKQADAPRVTMETLQAQAKKQKITFHVSCALKYPRLLKFVLSSCKLSDWILPFENGTSLTTFEHFSSVVASTRSPTSTNGFVIVYKG
jgi:hypothetical protein